MKCELTLMCLLGSYLVLLTALAQYACMALFHIHYSHRDRNDFERILGSGSCVQRSLNLTLLGPKSTPSRSSLWGVILSSSMSTGKIIKKKLHVSLWLSPSLLRPLPIISSPFLPLLSDGLLWMIRAGHLAVYSGSPLLFPFHGALIF